MHKIHRLRNIDPSHPGKMRLFHIIVVSIVMTLATNTGVHSFFFHRLYEAKKNFFFPSASTKSDLDCSQRREICQMETKCQPKSAMKCYRHEGSHQQVCRLETSTKCLQVPACRPVKRLKCYKYKILRWIYSWYSKCRFVDLYMEIKYLQKDCKCDFILLVLVGCRMKRWPQKDHQLLHKSLTTEIIENLFCNVFFLHGKVGGQFGSSIMAP